MEAGEFLLLETNFYKFRKALDRPFSFGIMELVVNIIQSLEYRS